MEKRGTKSSWAEVFYPNPPVCLSCPFISAQNLDFLSHIWMVLVWNLWKSLHGCRKKAYPIQVCCTYSRLLHRLDASATTSTLIWEHSRCVNYGLERDNILYIIFIFCEVWYSQKIFVCCLTINALITLWFCRIMSFICIVMMSQACRYGHFPKNTRPVSRRESGSSLQSVVPRQTGKQWWRWNVPRGWPTPPPKSRKWNAGVNQLGKDLI